MHRARARTASAVTVLALTAGLGACTAEPPPPPAAEGPAAPAPPDPRPDAAPLLRDVLGAMNEAGTADSRFQGRLGLVGELDGEGSVDYRQPEPELSFTGTTQPAPGVPAEPVELVLANGVGHLKSPLLMPEPAKPWLVVPEDGPEFTAQLFGPALRQLTETVDPRSTFADIEGATKIAASEPAEVDGRPATRYDLTVLTAPAAEAATDPRQKEQLQRAADEGKPELTYRLWVGEDDLPLRFATVQDVEQTGQVSLTTTYEDWGTDVTIEPPPPERIGEFRDLPPLAAPPR